MAAIISSFVVGKETVGKMLETALAGVSDGLVKATMNVLEFVELSETALELALGQENPLEMIGKIGVLFQDML